ncbi:MAG: DUF86 domain-containing protein [Candidatus Magnetobacterium sp. LHC-1]|nr:DUF86 domain-containing protein [Nitrospirota bacterium]
MNRDITLYIKDIIENMDKAEEFVGNLSYEDFLLDSKTHYSVVRCVEIIGEASKNVPGSIRSKHSNIPWKKMAGMRDKMSHFYFGVELEVVWNVVKEYIPRVRPLLKKVYEDMKVQDTEK